MDWPVMYNQDNIHTKSNLFIRGLTISLDEVAPKKEVTIRDRKVPWIGDEVIQAINNRDYHYNRFKLNRNEQEWVQYNICRNGVVKLLREKKRGFFEEMITKRKMVR